MKFTVAVLILSALVAPLAYAAECSAAQKATANVLANGEFETACSDVFNADSAGDVKLDPAKLLNANATTLAVLTPCKAPTCATYLKKQTDKVPDCEISGINTRVVYKTIVDFCNNVTATAPKTSDTKKAGSGSGSHAGTVKIKSDGSKLGSGIATVPSPAQNAVPSSTPAPATTTGDKDSDGKVTKANTKSDANSGAYAGATAIVAGALLTVLCM